MILNWTALFYWRKLFNRFVVGDTVKRILILKDFDDSIRYQRYQMKTVVRNSGQYLHFTIDARLQIYVQNHA